MIPVGIIASGTRYTVPVTLDDYVEAVLADSPLVYWKLDEPYSSFGGGTAFDSSGNSHHGMHTGSENAVGFDVHPVLAPPGHSMKYFTGEVIDNWDTDVGYMGNGVQSYSPFIGTDDFTIQFWIKPDSDAFADSDKDYVVLWATATVDLWSWTRIAWYRDYGWGAVVRRR